MIDLRLTQPEPSDDLADLAAFRLGDHTSAEDLEQLEALEHGGGEWELARDPAGGEDAWRLRRRGRGRAPSGWIFIENDGGPILFDPPEVDHAPWSLGAAIGRGHLAAFAPADPGDVRTSRSKGVVGLVAVVIMGAVPLPAEAAEPDVAGWDDLTRDIDPESPTVPRYGDGAVMATASAAPVVARVNANSGVPAPVPVDAWATLVGMNVQVTTAAGVTPGRLLVLDDTFVVVEGPAERPVRVPRASVLSIVPASMAAGDVYGPTYGRGRLVGGAVLTGLGAGAFLTGVILGGYMSGSYLKAWLPVMLVGVAMLGTGIPLTVGGKRRQKKRGTPKIETSQIRLLPLKTHTFTGGGLILRF